MPEFTFIVPAHNAERTIERCVFSILNDITQSNITCEILIIENGSSDNTYKKILVLQHAYSKVIQVYQSNTGVSAARNIGIEHSKGYYIVFVDADDLWLPASINMINRDLKTVSSDFLVYSYKKEKVSVIHKDISTKTLIEKKAWLISKPTLRMQVWAKVFCSSIIKKYYLRFNEKLAFSEDSEFVIRYLQHCRSVRTSKACIYRYMSDVPSAMRSINFDRMKGYMSSIDCSYQILSNVNADIKAAFWQYVLTHLNIILVHDIFDPSIECSIVFRMRKMREIMKEDIFNEALSQISFKQCLKIYLLPEVCMKIHLNIVAAGMCYIKAFLNHSHKRRNKIGENSCFWDD